MQEYLFEYYPIGRFVRVSVIDPATNEEATIVGDRKACLDTLQNTAIRKLKRLRRERASSVADTQPPISKQEDAPKNDHRGATTIDI